MRDPFLLRQNPRGSHNHNYVITSNTTMFLFSSNPLLPLAHGIASTDWGLSRKSAVDFLADSHLLWNAQVNLYI